MKSLLRIVTLLALAGACLQAEEPRSFSGIYPGLAMFNNEGECGTGAVVPWADRLWVITYAPHEPRGSSDKLYEISRDLRQTVRPESMGGTPANRMIHRESQQLFIGPYAIAADGTVRTIPWQKMFGRLTANARHLTDPAHKIVYATMEEGIYEVDVQSLEVKELWADEQTKMGRHADLPGYHGKGAYSGQGELIYANNGDHAPAALKDPTTASGALAEWDGLADKWHLVRRNQFTEITGPGGLQGAEHPETDPIWTIGWDHRSLILLLREAGQWQTFRLPKGSHSYDGAHGWNTEWPRIREIGEQDLLMTMHGTFWHFPKTFSAANTAGLAPRSNYLKVVGDFARWGDWVVLGCDDTAKNEFLNKRKAKGELAGPGQSQSNLWFIKPEGLDQCGPALGTGAVWLHDAVKAGVSSEPYLFSGYTQRQLHLATGTREPVDILPEVSDGLGIWRPLPAIQVRDGHAWVPFGKDLQAAWIRLTPNRDLASASAVFHYRNADTRLAQPAALFTGLADVEAPDYSGGLLLTRGENKRTLSFAATVVEKGQPAGEGLYELDAEMQLRPVDDAEALATLKTKAALPAGIITSDNASLLVVDDAGHRWRLPKGDPAFAKGSPLGRRVCREVCTERDLFQAEGILYELPAENAGGFAKMRALTSHHFNLVDYASYRGLLVLSGVAAGAPAGEHIIRSTDGKVALWAGAVDDLWQLGKPRGWGGPWAQARVQAGVPSDPFLLRGFDPRTSRLELTNHYSEPVTVTVEVDVTGSGDWLPVQTVPLAATQSARLPLSVGGYWLRVRSDRDAELSAQLAYE